MGEKKHIMFSVEVISQLLCLRVLAGVMSSNLNVCHYYKVLIEEQKYKLQNEKINLFFSYLCSTSVCAYAGFDLTICCVLVCVSQDGAAVVEMKLNFIFC